MPDLWMPGTIRVDGNPDQFGYETFGLHSPKRGDVKHSAVVNWTTSVPNGNNNAGGSWHFTLMKDGRVYQHYSADANCYHAGDIDDDGAVRANIDLIGIEHEGGPIGNESEPLTQPQIDNTLAVSRWAASVFGRTAFSRYPTQTGWTLVEHNQVSNRPTACPSGRIPWGVILPVLNRPPPVPVTPVGRAVDFSRFTGVPASDVIDCWKSLGVARAIVQYNTTGHFEQSVAALQGAGLELQAYVGRIADGISGPDITSRPQATRDCITRAAGRVSRIWQAQEEGSYFGTDFDAVQLRQALQLQAEADIPAGIYTRKNFWESATGNTSEFSHLPLWDARYLPAGSPWPTRLDGAGTSRPFLPHGGWSTCASWQWHNTTEVCGHSVDLNIHEPPPEPRRKRWAIAAID
jgi:N-acetylmuramoyl-L-alanine amidase-like protein